MNREEAINVGRVMADLIFERDKLIKELQDKILNLEPVWIPVTERMPTADDGWGKDKLVLVKTKTIQTIAWYNCVSDATFTHWARIVEPK